MRVSSSRSEIPSPKSSRRRSSVPQASGVVSPGGGGACWAVTRNRSPTALSGVQFAIATFPPLRVTRRSSAAVRSWSGANIAPNDDSVTSKVPSSNGSSWASAWTNSTSSSSAAARWRACSRSAGTKSAPVTFAKYRAAAIAALPLPQATASTRSFGSTPADSTRWSETPWTRGATYAKSPFDHTCCMTAVTAPKSTAASSCLAIPVSPPEGHGVMPASDPMTTERPIEAG